MAAHHPQGWARAPGGQLRYWVCSSVHGRLGGIGFCAASWHQKTRDDFIGWSADARAVNLSKAVNNHRFLLLPGVRVHGLASRVQSPPQSDVHSDVGGGAVQAVVLGDGDFERRPFRESQGPAETEHHPRVG